MTQFPQFFITSLLALSTVSLAQEAENPVSKTKPVITAEIIDHVDFGGDPGFGFWYGLQASNGYLLAPGYRGATLIPYEADGKFGRPMKVESDMPFSGYRLDDRNPPRLWTVGGVMFPLMYGVNVMGPPYEWKKSKPMDIAQNFRHTQWPVPIAGSDEALLTALAIDPNKSGANDMDLPTPTAPSTIYRIQPSGRWKKLISADQIDDTIEFQYFGQVVALLKDEYLISAGELGRGAILRLDPNGKVIGKIVGAKGTYRFGDDFKVSADGKLILTTWRTDPIDLFSSRLVIGNRQAPHHWKELSMPASVDYFYSGFGFLPTPNGRVIHVATRSKDRQSRIHFFEPHNGEYMGDLPIKVPEKWEPIQRLAPLGPGIYATILVNRDADKARLISMKCFE